MQYEKCNSHDAWNAVGWLFDLFNYAIEAASTHDVQCIFTLLECSLEFWLTLTYGSLDAATQSRKSRWFVSLLPRHHHGYRSWPTPHINTVLGDDCENNHPPPTTPSEGLTSELWVHCCACRTPRAAELRLTLNNALASSEQRPEIINYSELWGEQQNRTRHVRI